LKVTVHIAKARTLRNLLRIVKRRFVLLSNHEKMKEIDKAMAEAAININSRRGFGGSSSMISFPISEVITIASKH
jgi:hypothetical protein